MRFAVSGAASPRWFSSPPEPSSLTPRTGELGVEIVSHCWNYHNLLAYQLSSLVKYPPTGSLVTMTVFYSPEDEATADLLEYFGRIDVPRVKWNWSPVAKQLLFRRAIGRNRAALATEADWIWFTDCDVVFHEGCLDTLAERLQGRQELLVFPAIEQITPLLPANHPMLTAVADRPRLVEIDLGLFSPQPLTFAKGCHQITHGDVARAVGYCNSLKIYQQPADRWRKAWEDRAFRWLLGTDGVPVDIPGSYRIRHAAKGRYSHPVTGALRGSLRRAQSWMQDLRRGRD
ncbi:MAG: glycosyltransferase family 2 protein [Acidobacteria bacterium]|nr:glycosyltransferase family 2 protein [Acidobacteriota bacterium]